MDHDATRAVAPVERSAVPAAHAAVPQRQDRPNQSAPALEPLATPVGVEPPRPVTETTLQVGGDPQRVVLQVIDPETQTVLRSFPVLIPGSGAAAEHETARGGIVDAKA